MYMDFAGEIWCVFFQRRCRLKLLLPYGPMLTKENKHWQKSKI